MGAGEDNRDSLPAGILPASLSSFSVLTDGAETGVSVEAGSIGLFCLFVVCVCMMNTSAMGGVNSLLPIFSLWFAVTL